jgi:methenyltetrahydromethanopterin cyclohydrolase
MEDFSDLIPEKKTENKEIIIPEDVIIWGQRTYKSLADDIEKEIDEEILEEIKKKAAEDFGEPEYER